MTGPISKLAEFAAPMRGRPKYAPLTAGLLARKGEAFPATPYFAAEALDLHTSGPIVVSRHEPEPPSFSEGHDHDRGADGGRHHRNQSGVAIEGHRISVVPSRDGQSWRLRRPVVVPDLRSDAPAVEKLELKSSSEQSRVQARAFFAEHGLPEEEHAQRVQISLSLDLETLAKVALHARRTAKSFAQIVDHALEAHMAQIADAVATSVKPASESNS